MNGGGSSLSAATERPARYPDRGAAVRRLSGERIADLSAHGPRFHRYAFRRRNVDPMLWQPVLPRLGRVFIACVTIGWLVGVGAFWWWWLTVPAWTGWSGIIVFLAASVVLLYLSCEPLSYLGAVNRLREMKPPEATHAPRVAFVVTRAPSEPWPVARTTLEAMLSQQFSQPYDVWLCDEQPSAEGVEWCATHGVRISTRQGDDDYHRDDWPRRTRCKEGNLAYFYDHIGYEHYDVVAQLDCDHVPAVGYLTEVTRPFGDPAVGYVAAPSTCDRNVARSWSARGRLYREAYFHGPVQLGHSGRHAPICIGSHYAVRTQALAQIGGIGPELLEDFSTSFLLNVAGWRGVFAHSAEAHGKGPLTVSALLVQEFQWSRSLATLLYRVVPAHLRGLDAGLRVRYLFALLFHYALVAAISCGIAGLVIALVTDTTLPGVDPVGVILYWLANSLWLVVLTAYLRRAGLLRPRRAPVLSWESWLYRLTRWPFIAWGVGAATLQLLRPRAITFRVTPKQQGDQEPLAARLIVPHTVLGIVLAAAACVGAAGDMPPGWVLLGLSGAILYVVVPLAVCLLHAVETAGPLWSGPWRALNAITVPLLIAATTVPPTALAIAVFLFRRTE